MTDQKSGMEAAVYPRSMTYSMLPNSAWISEFGSLYGRRYVLKTYPKHVNSQTIVLQSKAK
jgi:hypothetical protein